MSLAASMTNEKTVWKTAFNYSRPDLKEQVAGKSLLRSREFEQERRWGVLFHENNLIVNLDEKDKKKTKKTQEK